MSNGLANRFYFGNNLQPSMADQARHFYGEMDHWRKSERMAEMSIAAAQQGWQELAAGNQRLANEMAAQHEALKAALGRGFEAVVGELQACSFHLADIKFAMVEQTEILRGVLHVLRENLSNEARQLVEQGKKNYRNGYHAEAIERLRRALVADNTFYEAHMTLGFCCVAVEDLPSAVEAFRKAVGFAPAEEPVFRTEAWLNLARVQFALGNDQEAYEESRRAIDAIMEKWILEEYQLHFRPHGHKLGDATLGKLYYQNAVYASRVGRREDALDALRKAILLDRRFLAAALREADWGIPRNEIVAECAERTETAIRTVGRLLGELQQAIGDHRPNIRETDLETIAAFAEGVARALPTGGYSWAMDTMRVLMEANTLVQLLAERAVLLAQKDEQTKALGDATAVAAKESAVLARRTSMAKVLSLGQMHKLSQRACLVSVILWVGLWCIIFYKMAVQWWPALGWPGHRQLYNVVYYGGLTFFAALGLLAMLAARTVGRRLSSSDRARAAAQARSAIERELRDTGSKISGLDSRVEEVAKRAGLRVARP